MDLAKAKLGAYDHERGLRTLYVPCAENEDPREQPQPAAGHVVAKPKPKRAKAKAKPKGDAE